MICQNSVSLTQFDNRLSPAITESDAAREQGVSTGQTAMQQGNRGFPRRAVSCVGLKCDWWGDQEIRRSGDRGNF